MGNCTRFGGVIGSKMRDFVGELANDRRRRTFFGVWVREVGGVINTGKGMLGFNALGHSPADVAVGDKGLMLSVWKMEHEQQGM